MALGIARIAWGVTDDRDLANGILAPLPDLGIAPGRGHSARYLSRHLRPFPDIPNVRLREPWAALMSVREAARRILGRDRIARGVVVQSNSLSDLPIRRTSRKMGYLIFSGTWVALMLLVAFVVLQSVHWSPSAIFAMHKWPLLVGGSIPPIYLFVATWLRTSSLLIDERGVHVTTNGTTRHYFWEDIDRAREVEVGRSGVVVQMLRKGQILTDKQSDLIWPEFGMTCDDLIRIVHEGQEKWGMQQRGLGGGPSITPA